MPTARALITGINGQDGHFLANALADRGVEIVGLDRAGTPADHLPEHTAVSEDIRDLDALKRLFSDVQPTQIYHLAAQSNVRASWENPTLTHEVTGMGAANVLDAARMTVPDARIFLASTSELFGKPDVSPQSEETPFRPASPYGAAKLWAHTLAGLYRQRFGMFVSCGILYNHESYRRTTDFVTMKIVQGAKDIAEGRSDKLSLGNLDQTRDWGYAGDFVEGMIRMLEVDEPGDFILATGVSRKIRDWCQASFSACNLNYQDYVEVDPAFWQPADEVPLVGDPSKAERDLGWTASTPFTDLVTSMLEGRPVR